MCMEALLWLFISMVIPEIYAPNSVSQLSPRFPFSIFCFSNINKLKRRMENKKKGGDGHSIDRGDLMVFVDLIMSNCLFHAQRLAIGWPIAHVCREASVPHRRLRNS